MQQIFEPAAIGLSFYSGPILFPASFCAGIRLTSTANGLAIAALRQLAHTPHLPTAATAVATDAAHTFLPGEVASCMCHSCPAKLRVQRM
jgi:hypothetical protein